MRFVTIILTLIGASALSAQEVVELEEITLSANFDSVEINQTGVQVEVISGEEIQKNQSRPVADLLGEQAGISISRTGPLGSNTSLLIRGTRQYESKVFIDGIDVTDPSLIQSYYNFGTMTMGDVERIEIVKGSQSAIYGSNAVGGVIDITSKYSKKDGWGGSIALEYGSYNTFNSSTTLAYKGEKFDVALTSTRASSTGFSAAEEKNGNGEEDGFASDRLSLRARYDRSDYIQFGLSAFTAWSEGEYDGFDFQKNEPVDADNLAKTEQFGMIGFARLHSDFVDHKLSYSTYSTNRKYEESVSKYGYEGGRSELSFKSDVDVMRNLGVSLHLQRREEYYRQVGDYGSAKEAATMNSSALGLNYENNELPINVNAAIRLDDHDIYGSEFTYRLAGAYHLNDQINLKGAYGTGFRAPSLYEANYGTTSDLKAETSASLDIEIEYRTERAAVSANYFQINTDNVIEYAGAFPNDYYRNVEGVSRRSGVEVSGFYEFSKNLSANFSYTGIDARNFDEERLTNIPAQEISLGAQASYLGAELGIDATFVSDVLDKNGEKLKDYSLVNASISYDIGKGEVYFRGENLLNEQYQTVKGFGSSDTAYYVGYRISF